MFSWLALPSAEETGQPARDDLLQLGWFGFSFGVCRRYDLGLTFIVCAQLLVHPCFRAPTVHLRGERHLPGIV